MYLKFTDESGTEIIIDGKRFYVVSGAIFHENALDEMKRKVAEFQRTVFVGPLAGAEIHVHDIYKQKRDFYGITKAQSEMILDKLYDMLSTVGFSIISVAIDKNALQKPEYKDIDVLEAAYTLLAERFDRFLAGTGNKGLIIIDRTSNKQAALNKKDRRILEVINRTRRRGTSRQSVTNIIEDPLFLESHTREGLQVADSVAYCTHARLNENQEFAKYWKMIEPKHHAGYDGTMRGYGLSIFPE